MVTPSNYIPLSMSMTQQNVKKQPGTYVDVEPKLSWYDGRSNSFHVSYTNGYGQRQVNGTYYTYNVDAPLTRYTLTSGSTYYKGTHYASVQTNYEMVSKSGSIEIYRR